MFKGIRAHGGKYSLDKLGRTTTITTRRPKVKKKKPDTALFSDVSSDSGSEDLDGTMVKLGPQHAVDLAADELRAASSSHVQSELAFLKAFADDCSGPGALL